MKKVWLIVVMVLTVLINLVALNVKVCCVCVCIMYMNIHVSTDLCFFSIYTLYDPFYMSIFLSNFLFLPLSLSHFRLSHVL